MNKLSPKVTAAGFTTLLASLIAGVLFDYVPGLKGQSQLVTEVATAVVTAGSGVAAGWYRKTVDWATVYVQEHQASQEGFVPGTPE